MPFCQSAVAGVKLNADQMQLISITKCTKICNKKSYGQLTLFVCQLAMRSNWGS